MKCPHKCTNSTDEEMVLAQTEQNRPDQRPTFHYLAEDHEEDQASGRLNQLVQRSAGAQWTRTKGTVVVDSVHHEQEEGELGALVLDLFVEVHLVPLRQSSTCPWKLTQ